MILIKTINKDKFMKTYKSIKMVQAEPMTRGDAADAGLLREDQIPSNEEEGSEEGYKVVYNGGKYTSWSPKKEFLEGNREYGIHVLDRVEEEIKKNEGKISTGFIDSEVDRGSVHYVQASDRTRLCIIRTEHGDEVVGVAQVLSVENDDPEKGKRVAFNNAREQLWKVYGGIAKAVGQKHE